MRRCVASIPATTGERGYSFVSLLWLLLLLLAVATTTTTAASNNYNSNNLDTLNSDSVILITGVAGFLGSELALALHRLYQPKLIVGLDSLDNPHTNNKNPGTTSTARSDQELALLEFKRQRIFRVQQTLGSKFTFYRVDPRPSIPEFYDSGHISILHHLFASSSSSQESSLANQVTHIVHLADPYHRADKNDNKDALWQAIPRTQGETKAGLMETILEQIRQSYFKDNEKNSNNNDNSSNNNEKRRRQPHFIYASSADVYNHYASETIQTDAITTTTTTTDGTAKSDPQTITQKHYYQAPFTEDSPITTPSSMEGTAKLLDEVLAQTYYDLEGIFSIGLRFFSVYGPWGLPGSQLFEMAERVVAGQAPVVNDDEGMDDIRDYIYIDDAIDALLSAMQFRPTTTANNNQEPRPFVLNVGSGQGTTLRAMAKEMTELVPSPGGSIDAVPRPPPSISFASTARAQQLLGLQPQVTIRQGLVQVLAWHYDRAFPYGAKSDKPAVAAALGSHGVASCSPYDHECLKGTPVFPCASECAHETQCTPSFWDDVMEYTKALTSGCHAVLYTVALQNELALLPSTVVRVSEKSKPYVGATDKNSKNNDSDNNCNIAFVSQDSVLYRKLSSRNSHQTVQHGFWRLIPVKITEHAKEYQWKALELLPKLSPGQFFSIACRHAIYADPDIIFHSIPKLLHEASLQPYSPQQIQGTTALLIGKRDPQHALETRWNTTRAQDQVQETAYRMIRLTLLDEMAGDGFAQLMDSSFVVHALAATTSEDSRLFRCDVYGEVLQWDASSDRAALEFITGLHDMWSRVICQKMGHEPWWIGDNVQTVDQDGNVIRTAAGGSAVASSRRLREDKEESSTKSSPLRHRRLQEEAAEDAMNDDGAADDAIVGDADHNGFGLKQVDLGDNGPKKQQQRHETPKDDDYFDLGDDWAQQMEAVLPLLPKTPRDPSTYDIWMGILSSTTVRSFSRIVTTQAVGAMHIDNYDEMAFGQESMEL